GGATEGVEFARVADGREEFRDDETFAGLLEVFAKAPPAEIINLLDLTVRTLEQGNVVLQPGPGFCVGDEVRDELVFHRVEAFNVMSESRGFQYGGGFSG